MNMDVKTWLEYVQDYNFARVKIRSKTSDEVLYEGFYDSCPLSIKELPLAYTFNATKTLNGLDYYLIYVYDGGLKNE